MGYSVSQMVKANKSALPPVLKKEGSPPAIPLLFVYGLPFPVAALPLLPVPTLL